MISKFLSFIAAVVLLFQFTFPEVPDLVKNDEVLIEPKPVYNSLKTYDEING